MDRKLRKILTECIRDIETGARDVAGCLQRHADRAAELRPHLELWSGLNATDKAEPDIGSQQRGQHQLLAALSEGERGGRKRMIPFLTPALAKAAAVTAAAVLLIGGAAGASAALGGPDVAGEVLSGFGINDTPGADREQERDRAFEDSDDVGEDVYETPEADREQETEREHERDKAFEDSDEADEDVYETPEANREQETERASEGPGNAGEGIDNASEAEREQEQEQTQTQEQDKEQEQTQEQTQAQTQEQAREGAFEGPGNGE